MLFAGLHVAMRISGLSRDADSNLIILIHSRVSPPPSSLDVPVRHLKLVDSLWVARAHYVDVWGDAHDLQISYTNRSVLSAPSHPNSLI